MKKTILTILGIIAITSCDSSSRNDNQEKYSIVGKWIQSKTIIVSGKDGSILNTQDANACENLSYLEFFSDISAKRVVFTGNTTQCDKTTDESGSYLYDNIENKITFTVNGINKIYNVNSLTNNELQILNGEGLYNNDSLPDQYITVYTK